MLRTFSTDLARRLGADTVVTSLPHRQRYAYCVISQRLSTSSLIIESRGKSGHALPKASARKAFCRLDSETWNRRIRQINERCKHMTHGVKITVTNMATNLGNTRLVRENLLRSLFIHTFLRRKKQLVEWIAQEKNIFSPSFFSLHITCQDNVIRKMESESMASEMCLRMFSGYQAA